MTTSPAGKRTIRRTVRGSLLGFIGSSFWANFGEAFDPEAERRAAAWLTRSVQAAIAAVRQSAQRAINRNREWEAGKVRPLDRVKLALDSKE